MSIAVRETCCCGAVIELDDLLTISERDRRVNLFHERHAVCAPTLPAPMLPNPPDFNPYWPPPVWCGPTDGKGER